MHHCSLSEQKTLLKVDWCENCVLLRAQCQSLNTSGARGFMEIMTKQIYFHGRGEFFLLSS